MDASEQQDYPSTIKGRQTNLSIMQYYAPTNHSNDRDKEAF